jgi:hypothetical protein
MTHAETIAATLALLGSGALTVSACNKDKPATEVPAAQTEGAPAAQPAEPEARCAAENHPLEGHCAAPEPDPAAGDASCSADAPDLGDPPE